ncbi:MAG: hypothetical protein K8I82_17640 [Anaerolineae bacterium]|nr:hypothetical protein [Anaerolineae bacterium]
MPHFYIEEDEEMGDIFIHDGAGEEIIRFHGENALEIALQWAKNNAFELRSSLGQDELVDIYRLFFRRGLRRLRLFRTQAPKDPPNIQRIIVQDFEYFFGEDEDDLWSSPPEFLPEEVELTPTGEEEEDERSENQYTPL